MPWVTAAPIFPEEAANLAFAGAIDLDSNVRLDRTPPEFRLGPTAVKIEEDVGKRWSFSSSNLALITEYQAGLWGVGGGPPPESRQSKWGGARQRIQLANLALWLARPSSLHFSLLVHFTAGDRPMPYLFPGLVVMPRYEGVRLTAVDFDWAKEFNSLLNQLPARTTAFVASRYLWLALHEESADLRLGVLSIAIEALFGPEDHQFIGKRIPSRAAALLGGDPSVQALNYVRLTEWWKARCDVMHGDTLEERPAWEKELLVNEAEDVVREGLRTVLADANIRVQFADFRTREICLEQLDAGFVSPSAKELDEARHKRRP